MLRRSLRVLAIALTMLGLLLVLVWAASRIISDDWRWSQYLYWVPQEAYLVGVLGLLFLACVAARLGGRARDRKRRPAHRPRIVLLICAAGLLSHTLLVRWRVVNLVTRRAPGADPHAIRVMDWNCTSVDKTQEIAAPLAKIDPDIAIFVNPHSAVAWHDLSRQFGAWNESRGAYDKPVAQAWDNGIIVLSRFAITREATISLGIPSAPDLDPDEAIAGASAHDDPGRAMFLELDTRERLGHNTIIWVIDLPSDPRLARTKVMDLAARAIREWSGSIRVRDDLGRWHAEPSNLRGFPTPDAIMGDFNIPRGSRSIRRLTGDMPSAFDRAGVGYAASWPRRPMPWPVSTKIPFIGRDGIAIFHLDQMFLGPALDAIRYDVVDTGAGYHRAQVAELVANRQ
jgi:hypothetical protein